LNGKIYVINGSIISHHLATLI
jgi:hypothetical protein